MFDFIRDIYDVSGIHLVVAVDVGLGLVLTRHNKIRRNGVRYLCALCYCACFSAIYFFIFSMRERVGSMRAVTSASETLK